LLTARPRAQRGTSARINTALETLTLLDALAHMLSDATFRIFLAEEQQLLRKP
jgi:hypothetical protein